VRALGKKREGGGSLKPKPLGAKSDYIRACGSAAGLMAHRASEKTEKTPKRKSEGVLIGRPRRWTWGHALPARAPRGKRGNAVVSLNEKKKAIPLTKNVPSAEQSLEDFLRGGGNEQRLSQKMEGRSAKKSSFRHFR